MIISRIKLRNFRQYRNDNIAFSTDPNKNVTVIIGDNTNGKTTLVCAFIWCLYRELGLRGPILNSDVANEMKVGDSQAVEVSIDLIHDQSQYHITTKQEFRKFETGIDKLSDAKTTIIKDSKLISKSQDVSNEIEYILRKDLKNYFFYDGENNRIESIGKKSSLKTAIFKMMKLDRVQDIQKLFSPTSNQGINAGLNNLLVSDNTPELKIYEANLSSKKHEYDKAEQEIKDNNKEIETLEQQLTEKESILSANADIEGDQNRRQALIKNIKDNKLKVDAKFNSALRTLNGRTPSVMHDVLLANIYKNNKLDELPKVSSFSNEDSLSHINEQVIDQLIVRGYCLCGTPITSENDARKHLEAAREHMEPNDFGRHLSDFCNSMENHVLRRDDELDRVANDCNVYLDIAESINKDQAELTEIEERIKGRPDVGSIQSDIQNIKQEIYSKEYLNKRIEKTDLPRIEKEIDEIKENIKKLSSISNENDLINKCIDYSDVIYDTATNVINNKQSEIRKELENKVNEIFKSMFHGLRNVKIDKDFNITTELLNGEALQASGGTGTVKNFSFVSGLISLVKTHILSENGGLFKDDGDDKYPLVLDAPFSGVDSVHINNICKILPNYCDQIIMVLLKDDYVKGEDTLKDRIGKKYHIHKISETNSEIKEDC